MTARISSFFVIIMCLLLSSCFENDIKPSTQTKDTNSTDARAVFPTNKFWAFFPRQVASDSYTVAYGPDGVAWPGLATSFRFFPSWVDAVFHDEYIYMVYQYQGQYHLHYSMDGLTFSNGQLTGLPVTSAGGQPNYPKLHSINGTLYAHIIYTEQGINSLQTWQYNTITRVFTKIAQSALNQFPDTSVRYSPPTIAKIDPYYYGFVKEVTGTTQKLRLLTSVDGVSFLVHSNIWFANTQIGHDMKAVPFKGKIFISYRRLDTNALAYFRFDGSSIVSYPGINGYKTQGINAPMTTDGIKLVISFRDGTNTSNRFVYSYDGEHWSLINAAGSSGTTYRTIVYTGNVE
jgi:hypothetical protein